MNSLRYFFKFKDLLSLRLHISENNVSRIYFVVSKDDGIFRTKFVSGTEEGFKGIPFMIGISPNPGLSELV